VSDGSSSARPGSLLTRCSRFGWPHYLLLALLSGATSAAQPPASAYPYTNRLIHSLDPYLLLHAHNPVDWYPWGAEALAKAKKENKPIFLSIGYSTCYWCHVAERTIYSNPRIAQLMNQWFVNVKVDREQRPDIDQLYMSARQIMTGNGSWPNNLFLTPDLKPFYAGSYFPPADEPAKGPGFPTVLRMLHESWLKERPKVDSVAQEVFTDLRQANQRAMNDAAAKIDPGSWLADARDTLLQMMDHRHGGIADSGGTRFPRSPELGLLLTDYQANHDEAALSALTETLDAIAYGGIHDHLAGGFHRYSTEPTWSIPHFEKMLSDNAQLLGLYTRSFQLTGNPLYRAQALATAHYLESDMMAVGGGFYGAQDAEVNGVEGASYLWTRNQIASVLGEAETQPLMTARVCCASACRSSLHCSSQAWPTRPSCSPPLRQTAPDSSRCDHAASSRCAMKKLSSQQTVSSSVRSHRAARRSISQHSSPGRASPRRGSGHPPMTRTRTRSGTRSFVSVPRHRDICRITRYWGAAILRWRARPVRGCGVLVPDYWRMKCCIDLPAPMVRCPAPWTRQIYWFL